MICSDAFDVTARAMADVQGAPGYGYVALMLERAVVDGGWQSTSGPAPLIVVNGPVRHRLGLNTTAGVLGPGFRANATVARAIGLIVLNGFGVRPHVFEQPTQGSPGRWAMCLGENEEESPWEPLSVDGALAPGTDGVSATLVCSFEYVDNRHTRNPEKLLADFADTLSRTGALVFRHASAGVVFCPEHSQLLGDAGITKDDVRRWPVEHCRRSRADLRRVGKDGLTDNGVRYDLDGRSGPTAERIFDAAASPKGSDDQRLMAKNFAYAPAAPDDLAGPLPLIQLDSTPMPD